MKKSTIDSIKTLWIYSIHLLCWGITLTESSLNMWIWCACQSSQSIYTYHTLFAVFVICGTGENWYDICYCHWIDRSYPQMNSSPPSRFVNVCEYATVLLSSLNWNSTTIWNKNCSLCVTTCTALRQVRRWICVCVWDFCVQPYHHCLHLLLFRIVSISMLFHWNALFISHWHWPKQCTLIDILEFCRQLFDMHFIIV